jgi:hypothetical protein
LPEQQNVEATSLKSQMERVGWQHPAPLQPRPAAQQTPAQQVLAQQVVELPQAGALLGHWQPAVALAQNAPPVQASPHFLQLLFVASGVQTLPQQPEPALQQAPAQQLAPWEQQATWFVVRDGQRFCTFPLHCLHALLQLLRWRLGRVLQ